MYIFLWRTRETDPRIIIKYSSLTIPMILHYAEFQQIPCSDCADAQTDLVHSARICSEGTFFLLMGHSIFFCDISLDFNMTKKLKLGTVFMQSNGTL